VQPPAVRKQKELEDLNDHAQVRLLLWLGLEKYQDRWRDNVSGDISTFAETVREKKSMETMLCNSLLGQDKLSSLRYT